MSSDFWQLTERRSEYAAKVASSVAAMPPTSRFDFVATLAAKGFCEPFVDLQWGPCISESELLAGKPGLYLDDWQWDTINCFNDPRFSRVSVAGNTGAGKNMVCALALLCYYYSHSPSKIVITRDTYDAAIVKAWGEVDRWARLMKSRPHGTLLTTGLSTSKQHFISVANPTTNEGFSGLHSESGSVAMWFDEATSIPQDRFDDASAQADRLIITFNPRTMNGPTRDAFPPGRDANVTGTRRGTFGLERHISVSGTKPETFPVFNVRNKRLKRPVGPLGGIEIDGKRYEQGHEIPQEVWQKAKPLVPGQTCYDEWLGLRANERTKRVFAFGCFPEESTDFQVVLASWMDAAVAKHRLWHRLMRCAKGEPQPGDQHWRTRIRRRQRLVERLERKLPINAIGLDVAGSDDGDETTLALGSWHGCREILVYQSSDLTKVADWVDEQLKARSVPKSTPLGCDSDGLGQGVANILARMGYNVIPLRGADKVQSKRWQNSRCERVGRIGERMDTTGEFAGKPFALPDDPKLRQELLAYEKFGANKDQTVMEVTPKRGSSVKINAGDTVKVIEPIVMQLKRSPDRADALGYMLAVAKRGGTMRAWLDALGE